MYCKNCGAKMPKDRDYCIRCGGKNQSGVPEMIQEEEVGEFQPSLPMRFHYFYLVLIFLSILLSLYFMFKEGFGVRDIINIIFELALFATMAKLQKVGYILFMISNTFSIFMLAFLYVLFLLSLFGITIFSRINPFFFLAQYAFYSSIDFMEIAKFTLLIALIVSIFIAIRIYYKKRRGMFS